ncbi:MAG: hypothetical protein AAFV46_13400 [Cyanobacteria bacterium J06635_11]
MPKPCRKPLKSNPFETHRDPVTGQWKVKYPNSALPEMSQPSALPTSEDDRLKRVAKRRKWKKPSRTRVA